MRSRKESIEIYDSNKKNLEIDKYMATYMTDQPGEEVVNGNNDTEMEVENTEKPKAQDEVADN